MRALIVALLFSVASASAQATYKIPARALTLEEIASFVSVTKLKEFLTRTGHDPVVQDNATMQAQGFVQEYQQSKSFGAVGRLWVVFPLRQNSNNATVHVSFFYDSGGYIVGRSIIVENCNID